MKLTMKVIWIVIVLSALLCACGGSGSGGNSIPEPEPGTIFTSYLESAVGDYVWEGEYGHNTGWSTPVGPYDGRIELISPTCIRVVVEMPDRDHRIDVRLYARNGECNQYSQWSIVSDPYIPLIGYGYSLISENNHLSLYQGYMINGKMDFYYLLGGTRQ